MLFIKSTTVLIVSASNAKHQTCTTLPYANSFLIISYKITYLATNYPDLETVCNTPRPRSSLVETEIEIMLALPRSRPRPTNSGLEAGSRSRPTSRLPSLMLDIPHIQTWDVFVFENTKYVFEIQNTVFCICI